MVETKFSNNVLTAYLSGEIDHDSAAQIRVRVDGMGALARALKERGIPLMDAEDVPD